MMNGETATNKIEQTYHSSLIKKEPTGQAALATANQNSHVLLPSKFITHHPKAGINPLVDAAAYLFSVIGKLKLSSFKSITQRLDYRN